MENKEQKKIMVKKSNALLRGTKDFDNIWQGRIFLFICSTMPNILTDAELQKYQFRAKDILIFAGKSKGKGKSQKEHLKKALMELQKKTISFNKGNVFKSYTIFPTVFYDELSHIITVTVHKDLIPQFYNIKKSFSKYNLMVYYMLDTPHAQNLYEFLVSWKNSPRFSDISHTLNTIYNIFNIQQGSVYRKNMYDFKRRVLDPSVGRINDCTEFQLSYEITKDYFKKDEGIRFILNKKQEPDTTDLIDYEEEPNLTEAEIGEALNTFCNAHPHKSIAAFVPKPEVNLEEITVAPDNSIIPSEKSSVIDNIEDSLADTIDEDAPF